MTQYLMQMIECGGISYPQYGYEIEQPDDYERLIDKPFDELTTDEWDFIYSNSEYEYDEENIDFNDNEFIEF